jgi:hypothetical protein
MHFCSQLETTEADMQAVEIQDHARKMMEAHGARAIAEAAQKAKSYEAQGEKEQAKDWRRIEAALRQLQGPRES